MSHIRAYFGAWIRNSIAYTENNGMYTHIHDPTSTAGLKLGRGRVVISHLAGPSIVGRRSSEFLVGRFHHKTGKP